MKTFKKVVSAIIIVGFIGGIGFLVFAYQGSNSKNFLDWITQYNISLEEAGAGDVTYDNPFDKK